MDLDELPESVGPTPSTTPARTHEHTHTHTHTAGPGKVGAGRVRSQGA